MSEGALPPSVARLVADASGFVEGVAKANGATREWQAELAKADIASRKTGVTAEAAAQRAATAMRRAAASATGLADAQTKAAAASERLAAGEATQEEAATAAAAASRAETLALEAQARAAIAAERASIAQAEATQRAATRAAAASDAQVAAASKSNAALTRVGKSSALAITAALGASVYLAGEFEQKTNVLVTAAGELPKNLKLVRDGILQIAQTTGTSWKQVTDGIYAVEKAGYRGADALKIVKASAQGAREEGANLSTVVQATTSVMASYHLKASDAVMVTNQIKTAAGEAKTTMELFSGSLSTVLPLASANKISFADVAGALASLTQHGTSADEAAQELAFTMRGLSAPNNVAINELNQLGLSSVDVSQKLGDGPGGRGLAGTLNYLAETVLKKMGPAGTLLLSTFNASKLASKDAATELAALPPEAKKLAEAYAAGTISLKDYRLELKGLPVDQASLAQQFATTENKAKGFQQTIRGGGSAAQTFSDAIKKVTGGAAGLNTVLQLTGESTAGTDERIKRIADSAKGAGKDVQGWASTQKLFNVQLDQFKQQLAAAGIKLGQELLPPLKAVLGVLTQHPVILEAVAAGIGLMAARWVALKALGLYQFIAGLTTRLLGLGAASTVAGGEAGLGGLARGATGAAAGIEGVGTAVAGSGLLVGGAAVLGIGAFALSLHQIFSDSVKGLPALNAVTAAIAKGGLAGKPGTAVVQASLAQVGTGNNRNENQLGYLQRILSTTDAKRAGLSLKGLFDTIQTGTSGEMKQFLDQLRNLEFQLKGSPDTIDKVGRYLDALFSRYNSGREDLGRYQKQQADATASTRAVITNVDQLSRTYGLNATQATALAAANRQYAFDLSVAKSQISLLNPSLTDNTANAHRNHDAIADVVAETVAHAQAVYRQTGSLKAAGDALRGGITTLENNAVAVGVNRGQVDNLVQSLLAAKANSRIDIEVTANGTFNLKDIYGGGDANAVIVGHHAAGGHIRGPGSGTSDSIPAWLSNGEFVVNAAATKAYLPLLAAINAGKGFAAGGLAGFDGAFIPNVNIHLDNLENAMNSKAQGWFGSRRTADMGALAASTGGAGVTQWIPQITAVLGMLGLPLSLLPRVLSQMNLESGGNPNAQNNWDSNAAIGQNSRGLMQTVPGTFAAYAGPFAGLGIFNPLANIYAGINYAAHRYAGDPNIGLGYGHGYAKGGLVGGSSALSYLAAHPDVADYLASQNKASAFLASASRNPATAGFLSTMAGFHREALDENTRAAFMNTMDARGQVTAANVPGIEAAAAHARAAASKVGTYFNAHKGALLATINSRTATAAQKNAARAVYQQLSSDVWHTTEDARQETALAASVRRRYAGSEAAVLTPGAPTRNWGYLAVAGGAAAGAGTTHVTAVIQLDGKVIGQSKHVFAGVQRQAQQVSRNNINSGLDARGR